MIRNLGFSLFTASLAFYSLSVVRAWADDTTVLAPIVVEGSTADALLYDPIVSKQVERVVPTSSNGSVVRQFEESLPVPVTDYGTPGTTTQMRGLGRTVEDTNVQTLGVPLNPPQGGGFDFSSFPQFFWSNYSFHLGPSSGGFDPRAATSTVSLTPWTAEALRIGNGKNSSQARVTEMVSRGLNQVSVAGHYQDVAALAGLSSINAKGPTGSISAQLTHDEKMNLRAHLLGTSMDETSPGPISAPSPNARLKKNRWIPILEASSSLSSDLLIKESAFYDRNTLRYVDPGSAFGGSYDRTNQLGSETVALYKDWTFGLSLRETEFTQIGASVPDEGIGHVQVERLFHAGDWTTQASVQTDWMNLYGFRPGASLGERYDISQDWAVFARGNFTYRYPTLLDRYYTGGNYVANPDLSLERALSFNIGTQWKIGAFERTEQVFLQFRSNAQITQYNPSTFASTVINAGDVRQLSYWDDTTWHATPLFDLGNSWRLSSSRIEATSGRIPYDPLFTDVLNARLHDKGESTLGWNAGSSLRVVTSSQVAGTVNGGYALWDLDAGLKYQGFGMQGRIDNLLDRRVQVVQGYPWPGRIFSLSLLAQL